MNPPITAGISEAIDTRIAELSKLEANWDSYRANPLDPKILERSKAFALALHNAGQPFFIAPHSDGGVGVSNNDEEIDFDLRPDGTVTLMLEKLSDEMALSLMRAAMTSARPDDETVETMTALIASGMQRGLKPSAIAKEVAASMPVSGDVVDAARKLLAAVEKTPKHLRLPAEVEAADQLKAVLP